MVIRAKSGHLNATLLRDKVAEICCLYILHLNILLSKDFIEYIILPQRSVLRVLIFVDIELDRSEVSRSLIAAHLSI